MLFTMHEPFNTCRLPKAGCFADHKEKVMDLLRSVCAVSARTQETGSAMNQAER